MASPEMGRLGQPDQPGKSTNIDRGSLGDPRALEQELLRPRGFNRFGPDAAAQFADWQRNGIARLVGVELPGHPSRPSWDTSRYMGVFGVIPCPPYRYSSDPHYLIVLPTKTDFDLLIVRQAVSTVSDTEIQDLEDHDSLTKIHAAFDPGQRPFVHPTWDVGVDENPRDAFLASAHLFGAAVVGMPFDGEKIDVLETAIQYREDQIEMERSSLEEEMSEPRTFGGRRGLLAGTDRIEEDPFVLWERQFGDHPEAS